MMNQIIKTNYMQPKIDRMKSIYRLALITTVMLIVACGASTKEKKSELTDKKLELQKLKDQQTKIAEQIKNLEQELAKLDPNAVTVNPKLVSVATVTTQSFAHYIDLQGKVAS